MSPAQIERERGERPTLIGITGLRNVGKSTVTTTLCEQYGFRRAHAFDGGKEATFAYFEYITGSKERAARMVWGDLKDQRCADLPEGQSPRYFMERFGKFMGVDLGTPWTMEMEIERKRRIHGAGCLIVVESLIYEADLFRKLGGYILRLERPGHDGPKVDSDVAQAGIREDYKISATSIPEQREKVREWLKSIGYQRA